MNLNDLTQLINNGENSYVEFINSKIACTKLAKELTAFANFEGGVILLGVEDNGDISGVSENNLEEYIMNICRNNISPEIIPGFEKINTDKGIVAVISTAKGISKPYCVNGRHYIRVGSTKRIASREELIRLFQHSGVVHYDITPVNRTSIKDLNLETIRDYFLDYNMFDLFDEDENKRINILENADILIRHGESVMCSVGGLLIFGHNVTKYLSQAGISFAHFKGNNISSELIDKKIITGTLIEQVEKMMDIFNLHILRPSTIIGAKREEKVYYPALVLRETLVNALVHRNYQISGSMIRIFMFEDRIEFRSPGRLPNTVTIPKMKIGVSYARNPFIVKYMENFRYIDKLGRGIPMIIKKMKETRAKEPFLKVEGEEFILTLYQKKDS